MNNLGQTPGSSLASSLAAILKPNLSKLDGTLQCILAKIGMRDKRPMLNLPKPARAERIDCLKIGTRPGQKVDQAQQESPRDRDDAHKKEFLRCAACQYPVARKNDRIAVSEKHRHVFANPHGYIYQIGCFSQAPGCVAIGEESSQFSWFPGYTWRVALCGQCLTLLGWSFRSRASLFFGLILDKLTEDILQ